MTGAHAQHVSAIRSDHRWPPFRIERCDLPVHTGARLHTHSNIGILCRGLGEGSSYGSHVLGVGSRCMLNDPAWWRLSEPSNLEQRGGRRQLGEKSPCACCCF